MLSSDLPAEQRRRPDVRCSRPGEPPALADEPPPARLRGDARLAARRRRPARPDAWAAGRGHRSARRSRARRTVYGFIDRQNLPGLFRTFDFASPDAHSPQRFTTTVPQQALFLMNSPFVVEQAPAARGAAGAWREPTATSASRRSTELRLRPRADADETGAGAAIRRRTRRRPAPEDRTARRVAVRLRRRTTSERARSRPFTPLPHFTGDVWQGGGEAARPEARLGHAHRRRRPPGQRRGARRHPPLGRAADGRSSRRGRQSGTHARRRATASAGGSCASRDGELASWSVHSSQAVTKLENGRGESRATRSISSSTAAASRASTASPGPPRSGGRAQLADGGRQ